MTRRTLGRFICASGLILAGACAVCHAGGSRAGNEPGLNVVLICLNALRADHLKAYGYGTETAPNISGLAGEAAVFEAAVAQSHWTLPSLASLFTSKYVHSHGLYERGGKLSEHEVTLAEMLKARGYLTAAFTGGLDMSGAYGLKQGFDVYFDDTGNKPMGSFERIMPRALNWLTARKDDRFFLFVDSYDIHPPFDKPEPGPKASEYAGALKGLVLDYNRLKDFKNGALLLNGREVKLSKADLDYIVSRYDAGIAYADRFVGGLLAKLEELELSGNTVIILTSEHGEELADHGSFDRFGRKNLYEESIRVPLIIKNPRINSKGARISAQAQLIDVMPTVLDMLAVPVNKEAQGASLVPLMEGGKTEKDFNRCVYSEASFHKWAVRAGQWKLIYESGKYELFNLADDRAEIGNLAEKNPAVVYGLAQELMRWRRKTRTDKSPDDTRVTVTEEMKRKLKEAGYWR
ncbi:MAG: sulfatase [Elusimicrobia bacterium]|nr:sulfatase [Elusimicrobiota bacterium]